jgi:Ser/Thr protein kinase RdoA (MazF antagonist)
LPEQARRLVEELFPGGRITGVDMLSGGISSPMLRVDVDVPDRSRTISVIVRSAPDDDPLVRSGAVDVNRLPLRREAALLDHLVEAGASVPAVLAGDGQHLVLEFIEGQPLYDSSDPVGLAHTMAQALAKIHAVERPDIDLPWRTRFVGQHLALGASGADLELREPEILDALRSVWPPDHGEARLLHGDFWPGNLVWRRDDLVGVVDWEDAAFGDVHADVSISRLDLRWVFGIEASEAFTAAYDEITPLDDRRLAIWDLVAAKRPCGVLAVWAANWPELGRPDISEATMQVVHRAFVDQALAVLAD